MEFKLRYKGFVGSIYYDHVSRVYHGKSSLGSEMVTYMGESQYDLRNAFEETVNRYTSMLTKPCKSPKN
jgi:predicted HicB family RNase H-like nuclease